MRGPNRDNTRCGRDTTYELEHATLFLNEGYTKYGPFFTLCFVIRPGDELAGGRIVQSLPDSGVA